MKYTFGIVLVFFFIFAFRLPLFLNSTYIVYVLSAFLFFLSSKVRHNTLIIIKTPVFFLLFLSILGLLIFTIVSVLINQTEDISIFPTLINNLIALFSASIVAACLFSTSSKNIYNYFFLVLFLQSISIMLMMFFPNFNELVQSVIRTESETEFMAQTYGGVRGFGISGSVAFGLSIVMSILAFFTLVWFGDSSCKLKLYVKVALIALIAFASISAGRTSILGFSLGLAYLYFTTKPLKSIRNTLLLSFYIMLFGVSIWFLVKDTLVFSLLVKYSEYAFQMFYHYIDHGSFTTTSTTKLSSMYFGLTDWQVIIGDGLYTLDNGEYYLDTDAGFMRLALLFGVLLSILIYISFLLYTILMTKYVSEKSSLLLMTMIAFMTFVFHYKGEVIYINVGYMKVLYLFSFYWILKNRSS